VRTREIIGFATRCSGRILSMKVESVLVSELVLDPANARKHSGKNLDAIAGSLREFGQRKPIVVTAAGVVVAGNGTLEAARSLGWERIDVVRVPADWSADQVKAFALADNRTAELAEWNPEVLSAQLLDLGEAGFDIKALGFDVDNASVESESLEESIVEPPVEPVTRLGDIWLLGNHRLMCGDSFERSSIERLMNGDKADMVFTDPPYGMALDTDYTKMGSGGRKHNAVINDNQQFDASLILNVFDYCKEIFLWGADYYVETLGRKYPNLGSWIIWDKYSDERIGLLDGRFGSTFETCWSKSAHKREIARVLVTTNYTARGDETRVHPTQKPVALAEWFIERWGKAANIIVDLFAGSGFTIMACERMDKSCYAMEFDPKYCDVIVQRWEAFTGKKAVLENASR
jgi:DNA modification methylase